MAKKSKLKAALVVGLGLLILVSIAFGVYRANQVRKLMDLEISPLEDEETIELFDRARVESAGKMTLILFTMREVEGFVYVDNLALANVGQWVLEVPTSVYAKSDANGGYIEIEKLYAAGERLVADRSGLVYLMEQMEELTGTNIDGFVAVRVGTDTRGGMSWGGFFTDLSQKSFWLRPEASAELIASVHSNIDLEGLLFVSNQMNLDRVVVKSLDSGMAVPVAYQGRQVSVFETGYVDNVVREFPKSTELLLEQARVEVYNGTEAAGLASRYSRVLKNSGLDVMRIEDAPQYVELTTVYVPKGDEFVHSTQVVTHDLSDDILVVYEAPPFQTRGDVVILLGLDGEQW